MSWEFIQKKLDFLENDKFFFLDILIKYIYIYIKLSLINLLYDELETFISYGGVARSAAKWEQKVLAYDNIV